MYYCCPRCVYNLNIINSYFNLNFNDQLSYIFINIEFRYVYNL